LSAGRCASKSGRGHDTLRSRQRERIRHDRDRSLWERTGFEKEERIAERKKTGGSESKRGSPRKSSRGTSAKEGSTIIGRSRRDLGTAIGKKHVWKKEIRGTFPKREKPRPCKEGNDVTTTISSRTEGEGCRWHSRGSKSYGAHEKKACGSGKKHALTSACDRSLK